jgi:hypothetical protein
MKFNKKYIIPSLVVFGLLLLLRLSFDKLIESPPTWMDEGIIIQTARNFSNTGFSGLRIDPSTIVSSGYVTTSYPVTIPIALSYKMFGINLYNARVVMAIFIFLLVLSVVIYFKKRGQTNYVILMTLFLVITFPPLYGQGKNVLGEVPGLFLLFSSMIFLEYLYIIPACLLIGLTLVTKPIFILLVPAIFIACVLNYKEILAIKFDKKNIILFILSLVALTTPIIYWFIFQFHGETLGEMFAIYANPHSTNFENSFIVNSLRFLKESKPIYAGILTLFWSVVIYFKIKRKETIKISELILWSFSLFIIFAYLRTAGYYRYFFLAQFIALVHLPSILFYFYRNTSFKYFCFLIIFALIIIQSYSLAFTSWIAVYSNNTQSKELSAFMDQFSGKDEIFIYQAPELVSFIKNENYSQYLDITSTIKVGSTSLQRIVDGTPAFIATNSNYVKKIQDINSKYESYKTIGKYQFLQKK